jgi:spermidine synthase
MSGVDPGETLALQADRRAARDCDMARDFEELDHCDTPLGELSLRRRRYISLGVDVLEVKLGDEFLMSSLFTASEIALAHLGLAAAGAAELDVVVGGLGLGYTARAALDHAEVRSVLVVEAIPQVIDWHRRGLVPLGNGLANEPRCRLIQGDFFALARNAAQGFDPKFPGRRFDAVLLDIDHSPRSVLHSSHGGFYTSDGLRRLASQLEPGGIFALWSNDPPDNEFLQVLRGAFAAAESRVVTFHNPLQNREAASTVYIARNGAAPN